MTEITVTADLVEIPDLQPGSDEWAEWCEDHNIYPLGSSRRAWIPQVASYMRASKYLVMRHGTIIDLHGYSDFAKELDKRAWEEAARSYPQLKQLLDPKGAPKK